MSQSRLEQEGLVEEEAPTVTTEALAGTEAIQILDHSLWPREEPVGQAERLKEQAGDWVGKVVVEEQVLYQSPGAMERTEWLVERGKRQAETADRARKVSRGG